MISSRPSRSRRRCWPTFAITCRDLQKLRSARSLPPLLRPHSARPNLSQSCNRRGKNCIKFKNYRPAQMSPWRAFVYFRPERMGQVDVCRDGHRARLSKVTDLGQTHVRLLQDGVKVSRIQLSCRLVGKNSLKKREHALFYHRVVFVIKNLPIVIFFLSKDSPFFQICTKWRESDDKRPKKCSSQW